MTSDRVCKNCDYGLYASTGCGFYPPDREKGCEHFKSKCYDKPICKKIAIEEIEQKMNEICRKCPDGKAEWCGDCHFDELAETLGIKLYWQGKKIIK